MINKSDLSMTPEEIEKLPYRPCVGLMLLNAAGEVFVGQRLDRDYEAWQMPQGGVDPGEDPRDAALRELEEETGITSDLVEIEAESASWLPYELPRELVPKLWKGKYRGQEQKWFLLRFNGTDDQVNIQTAEPEFREWRWLAAAEMLDGIVPFKRDVYARVVEEFGEFL